MTDPCPALAYVRDKKVGDKNLVFTSSASNKLPHPGQLREQAEFFFMHDAEKPVLPTVFETVIARRSRMKNTATGKTCLLSMSPTLPMLPMLPMSPMSPMSPVSPTLPMSPMSLGLPKACGYPVFSHFWPG